MHCQARFDELLNCASQIIAPRATFIQHYESFGFRQSILVLKTNDGAFTDSLVFEQTVDEKIYERLSERMKDRYDLFGSLPDTIKDEWIEDIETLGERLDEYINAQKTATGFDLHYTGTMVPPEKDWRELTEVLSRRDLATLMSAAWG